MWTCKCFAENKVANQQCHRCGGIMPDAERERIYREQLKHAQKRQFEWITNLWRNFIGLFGNTAQTVKEDVTGIFVEVNDKIQKL